MRMNREQESQVLLYAARVRPQRQVEAALVPLPRDLRVKRHGDEQRAGDVLLYRARVRPQRQVEALLDPLPWTL